MELNVTAELVQDLYLYMQNTRRPAETGIVLGADGWETRTWVGHSSAPDPGVLACTGEDILVLADGEDIDEQIDDIADMLLRPDCGGTYQVPDEYGDLAPNAPNAPDGAVVVGVVDEYGEVAETWEDAWWFDRAAAKLVVPEAKRLGDEAATVTSLWQTESGRWVQQTRQVTGDCRDHWAELDEEQAAEYIYSADPDEVDGDSPLAAAAAAARRLVDALAPTQIPWSQVRTRTDLAESVLRQNTAAVHTARAISNLLRKNVLADIREHRVAAVERVVAAFGHEHGARTRAAEHLGMPPQTLNNLLP